MRIIGIAGFILCHEFITQICEFVEGCVIVSIGEIRNNLFSNIIDAGIGERRDGFSAGGYVPIRGIHHNDQNQTVVVITVAVAVIIVEIIGIFHRCIITDGFKYSRNHFHLMTVADFVILGIQFDFFGICQEIRVIEY